MINRNPLILLAAFFLLSTVASGQEWKLPGQNLQAALWLDDSTLIMVGDKGTLLTSTDAGRTLHQHQHFTAETLRDIAANQAADVLVVGGSTVLKSDDGGVSWEHFNLGDGRDYKAVVSFPGDEWGLFFTDLGKLYMERVGGSSLESVDTVAFSVDSARSPAALTVLADGSYILIALHPDLRRGSDVYRSTDTGRTWTLVHHLHRSVESIAVLDTVIFTLTRGVDAPRFLYYSRNAGESWDSIQTQELSSIDISGIGSDGKRLLVMAEDLENQRIWTYDYQKDQLAPAPEQIVPGFMLFRNAYFSPTGVSAVITGTQGTIVLRGKDGIWRDRSRSVFATVTGTNQFLKAEPTSPSQAAIIGMDIFSQRGIALSTFDTATTFYPHTYLSLVNDLTLLDSLLITSLVGRNDQIYVSSDSGRSWILSTTRLDPEYTYLQSQSIARAGDSTLFVTADTLLYSSDNRGASWQIEKTFSPATLIGDLDFSSDEVGHLIRTHLTLGKDLATTYTQSIYLSMDQGRTWDSVFSFTSPQDQPALVKVDFPSRSLGVAGFGTFAQTTLVRTVDGGVNWDTTAEVQGGIRDIQMFSDQVGVAVGVDRGGLVLVTQDGGKTWERPEGIPLSDTAFVDLRFVSLFSDGHTLFIGGAGIFLKGSFNESILSVRNDKRFSGYDQLTISLTPHPIRNGILTGHATGMKTGTIEYSIVGTNGSVLALGSIPVSESGLFSIREHGSMLPPGAYFLQVRQGDRIAQSPFLIVE